MIWSVLWAKAAWLRPALVNDSRRTCRRPSCAVMLG